jgi:hypothetical protein
MLLAVTVLVSTGTAGTLWRQARLSWLEHNAPTLTRATITPQPVGQRMLPGGWQQQPQVALPTPNVHWYIPAPKDPQTLYGCSAAQTTATGGQQVGPLVFWYSRDAGQHWSSVRLPATKDAYCGVIIAPDASGRLILQGQLYSGCTKVDAFQSKDGGATWYAIPSLPDAPAPDNSCRVSLWLSAHHLYLSYGFTTYSGPPQNRTDTYHTSLWRSDDGGQAWKQLDASLPLGDDGAVPQMLDDGETLLLILPDFTPSADGKPPHEESKLWVSYDAGDSWEPWGNLQDLAVGQVLTEPEDHTLTPSLAHSLYLLDEAYPSSLRFRIQIAQVTDTRHWAPLPPLPIAGATPAHLGITSVLAETASGKLLVFGLGPNDHVPSDDAQASAAPKPAQQWLWEWDPPISRWTLLTPALNAPWPETCSEGCWQGWLAPNQGSDGVGMYLWVRGYFADEPAHWQTFRILLPDPL